MFVGFVGRAWSIDKEVTLGVGERATIEEYTVTYTGPRMETDAEKRMIFADLDVARGGQFVGKLHPASFVIVPRVIPRRRRLRDSCRRVMTCTSLLGW